MSQPVSVGPGLTALTVMPRSISAADSVRSPGGALLGDGVGHLGGHAAEVLAGGHQDDAAAGPAVVPVANSLMSSRRADVLVQERVEFGAVSSSSVPLPLRAWFMTRMSTWPKAVLAAASTRAGRRDRRNRPRRARSGRRRRRGSCRTPSIPPGSAPHGCAASCGVHDWTSTLRRRRAAGGRSQSRSRRGG